MIYCVLLNTSKKVIVFPNGKNWTVLVIGPQLVYTDISTECYLTKFQYYMEETLIFPSVHVLLVIILLKPCIS